MDSFPQSKCFLFYDVKYSSREMSSRMCNPRHCIMDSSALVCPGGGYGYIANFVASFCNCGLAAKSIGFAILNFRSVDPIGYLCFNFQDWLILPFRQKSSAHSIRASVKLGAKCIARGRMCNSLPRVGLISLHVRAQFLFAK